MTGVTRIAAHRRPRRLVFGNPCLFSPGIVIASAKFIFPVRAFMHYAEGDGSGIHSAIVLSKGKL